MRTGRHLTGPAFALVLFLALGPAHAARPFWKRLFEPSRSVASTAVSTVPVSLQTEAAYAELARDRIAQCRQVARGLAREHPRHPSVLILEGVLALYSLDLEAARNRLEAAKLITSTDGRAHLRAGDLWMALGDNVRALSSYDRAAVLGVDDALLHLDLAASHFRAQRAAQGKTALQTARQRGVGTLEEGLMEATVVFLEGRLDEVESLLDRLEQRYGTVASTHFLRSTLALRRGRRDLAGPLLFKAARAGAENPFLLAQIASFYTALDDLDSSAQVLEAAVSRHPRSRKLQAQLVQVKLRRDSGPVKEKTSGVFHVRWASRVSDQTVDQVLGLARPHVKDLSVLFGYSPKVIDVRIVRQTGFSAPAYYNNLTGDITLAAAAFESKDPGRKKFADHAVRHELAHLFVWDRLKGVARSHNALWLDEGLAEHVSGGVDYLNGLGLSPREIMADGPMPLADLVASINMLWHDDRPSLKAYVQAYHMVDYLMSRAPTAGNGQPSALAQLVKLLERVAADEPLEKALFDLYSMDLETFQRAWQAHWTRKNAQK